MPVQDNMKNKIGVGIASLLLLGLTVGYIFLMGLGLKELGHQFKGLSADLPEPTILFANPDSVFLWVLLALTSLIGNIFWWRARAKNNNLTEPYLLPMLCHTLWILLCLMAHTLAAMLPFLCLCEGPL